MTGGGAGGLNSIRCIITCLGRAQLSVCQAFLSGHVWITHYTGLIFTHARAMGKYNAECEGEEQRATGSDLYAHYCPAK